MKYTSEYINTHPVVIQCHNAKESLQVLNYIGKGNSYTYGGEVCADMKKYPDDEHFPINLGKYNVDDSSCPLICFWGDNGDGRKIIQFSELFKLHYEIY